MRAFFHRNVLVIFLGCLFGLAAVSYGVVTADQQRELAAQAQEIADLEAQMRAQVSGAQAEQESVVDNALGTETRRVSQDTEVITEFLDLATSWESGEEYSAARESVMRRYKLDPGSQFMSTYFQEPVFNTDSSGNRFYVVDVEGLNSSLSSVDVKVLGVEGTKYRYMVLADIAASSNDGKGSATTTSVIYLTVDGEQVVTDVSGYASVSGALTSGS